MRTILVKDVLARVSEILQDSDPQFTRWGEQELVRWLNDAQRALFKFLPMAGSRVDAVRLKPGTRQDITKILAAGLKPLDGSTPPAETYGMGLIEVPRNMGPDGLTPGRAITIMDRQKMDASSPNWHTSSGEVIRQYAFNPQVPRLFYVSPGVPATTNVWVELHWIAEPSQIPEGGPHGAEIYKSDGTNAAVIGVHDENIDELVNYTAARALFKDAKNLTNMNRAGMHAQMFMASINARVAQATGQNPNLKTLPLMGEPMAAAS